MHPGCDQDTPHTENNSDIGREVLLMFTLSGFGGAASLAIVEAMINSNSNGGAASASALVTYSAEMPTYP
jgi:hypothetical protein